MQTVWSCFSDTMKKKRVLNNKLINYVITLTNKDGYLSTLKCFVCIPTYVYKFKNIRFSIYFLLTEFKLSEYPIYKIYPDSKCLTKQIIILL